MTHTPVPHADRDRSEEPDGYCTCDQRPSIDADHIAHQREWSERTFGPGMRLGVIDHIRKELLEVEADPTDLGEWVDVIILGLDGAWRAGHEPQAIIDAIKAKQARNEARTWPDWRNVPRDVAIEHVRTALDRARMERAQAEDAEMKGAPGGTRSGRRAAICARRSGCSGTPHPRRRLSLIGHPLTGAPSRCTMDT